MPLYTYVVSYKGATHVIQARRSNYRGFGDWASELPKGALPAGLMKDVFEQMYGDFDPIPNRTHAWRKSFPIDGSDFVVIAVQTES